MASHVHRNIGTGKAGLGSREHWSEDCTYKDMQVS